MSTSRKLVGPLLVAAAFGFLAGQSWSQTVGGDVVGTVVARNLSDLEALGDCLRDQQLRSQVDPLLAAGEAVTQLSFSLFFESQAGDQIYLGSMTVGGSAWSWVHYRPGAAGSATFTFVRASVPSSSIPAGRIVPDAAGLDLIALATARPPAAVEAACAVELDQRKLTGLRVTRSAVVNRADRYRLEYFFDGDLVSRVAVSADFVGGVLCSLTME